MGKSNAMIFIDQLDNAINALESDIEKYKTGEISKTVMTASLTVAKATIAACFGGAVSGILIEAKMEALKQVKSDDHG